MRFWKLSVWLRSQSCILDLKLFSRPPKSRSVIFAVVGAGIFRESRQRIVSLLMGTPVLHRVAVIRHCMEQNAVCLVCQLETPVARSKERNLALGVFFSNLRRVVVGLWKLFGCNFLLLELHLCHWVLYCGFIWAVASVPGFRSLFGDVIILLLSSSGFLVKSRMFGKDRVLFSLAGVLGVVLRVSPTPCMQPGNIRLRRNRDRPWTRDGIARSWHRSRLCRLKGSIFFWIHQPTFSCADHFIRHRTRVFTDSGSLTLRFPTQAASWQVDLVARIFALE